MPIYTNQQTTKPGGRHFKAPLSPKVNGFFTVEGTKAKLVVVEVAVMTKTDFGIILGKPT